MNTKILKTVKIGFCALAASALVFAAAGKIASSANAVSANAETAIAAEAASGTTVDFDYTVNSNNTVTVTVSITGNVRFAAFTGEVHYDSSVLTYSSSSAICSGIQLNNKSAGEFAFSYASATDITSDTDMFKITFAYSGTVNTNLSLVIEDGNFCNASFEDVTYSVSGTNIVVTGNESSSSSSSSSSSDDANVVVSCGTISGGSAFTTGMFIIAAGTLLIAARSLRSKKNRV